VLEATITIIRRVTARMVRNFIREQVSDYKADRHILRIRATLIVPLVIFSIRIRRQLDIDSALSDGLIQNKNIFFRQEFQDFISI
jgi:hypothetical protein